MYFEYVELPVAGVSGGQTAPTFTFNDQAQIRTSPILSICWFWPSTISLSPLSGSPLVSAANMKNSYLTLNQNDPYNNNVNKNGVDLMPAALLNYINDGSAPYVYQQPLMGGQIVIWDKSFVTCKTVGGPGNTTNQVYLFGVWYSYSTGVQGATS